MQGKLISLPVILAMPTTFISVVRSLVKDLYHSSIYSQNLLNTIDGPNKIIKNYWATVSLIKIYGVSQDPVAGGP